MSERPDRATQLHDLLRSGETVIWQGAPDPKVRFSSGDMVLIPFSIVWGGFALVWNIAAWGSGAPLSFKLFGLPFLAIGGYITVGRFFVTAKRKEQTTYALTTQRAVIIDDLSQVRFVELSTVLHETRTQQKGRAVTVEFRSPSDSTSSFRAFGPQQDPRLSSVMNKSRNQATAFVFMGVTDAAALLHALADAPSAN
jgi:hypothetical protein